MRLLRRPELRLVVLVGIGVAAWLTVRGSQGPTAPPQAREAVSWRGLVGDARPAVSLAGRTIVLLRTPSVAQRLATASFVTETVERGWTAEVFAAQQQVLTQLARHGLSVRPDYSFARVIDGFSATLDPRAIALLEHNPEVAGLYPVRAAYPAAISSKPLAGRAVAPPAGLPGIDGNGISIALLDTGVALGHAYLGGRVDPGIDIVGGTGNAAAQRDPQRHGLIERHGTELAGILVGSGGPEGIHGVAPRASLLPIRVAGWQPAANGRDAVYARSDQIIAGLDRAVDPNGDGDTHDAVRIALVGVTEPFASFSDSPEAQAVTGARALDVLVVVPAGNDGDAGPLYGSIAGPAGSPDAVAVAATDSRPVTAKVRVVLRQGLAVLSDGSFPLLGSDAPDHVTSLPLAVPGEPGSLTGKAALIPAGANPAAAVKAAVDDGAAAVLVYGRALPASSLGQLGIPVVGLPERDAAAALAATRQRFAVYASLGKTATVQNPDFGQLATFSSRGLTLGGLLEPQLAAPGTGIATASPGSAGGEPNFTSVTGTSAAAATVAGAAALLAQAHPGLGATDLASLLVGSARNAGTWPVAGGTGIVDPGASAVGEVTASETTLAFGPWTGPHWHTSRTLELHNVSTRPLSIQVGSSSRLLAIEPAGLTLAPGARATVKITAAASTRPALALVTGTLAVRPSGGQALRIPWAIVFRPPTGSLIRQVTLDRTSFSPSDSNPAVLQVVAGRLVGGNSVQIEAAARLDVLLYTSGGAYLGVLARVRDVLPGDYSFAIPGRGPGGATLAPGSYEIRVAAIPLLGGEASRGRITFRIE